MLVLNPGEIHVWLAYYEEIQDRRLHEEYLQLLSDEEKEKQSRFHFADDRQRYLITRALVRTVLSRFATVSPKNWLFDVNRYGRPEIANASMRESKLTFNISHTRGLIVLGVTQDRAFGVDVENIQAHGMSIDIAERFFAPTEISALRALAPDRQQYRFLEYWTFKESYIKARGMGLSLPLEKFSFCCSDEGHVELKTQPEMDDDAARWRFWQFHLDKRYLLALCAEQFDSHSTNLVIRRIVPLHSEQPITMSPLRTSHPDRDRAIGSNTTL